MPPSASPPGKKTSEDHGSHHHAHSGTPGWQGLPWRAARAYHVGYTMVRVLFAEEANAELDALYDQDEDAAALFDLLLQELDANDHVRDLLFRPANHFNFTPPFDVGRVGEAQKLGKNVYRIKVRNEAGQFVPWRMLLGFHAQIDVFYVLSVLPRDHAYDTGHESFRQALSRYERLGIPDYRP